MSSNITFSGPFIKRMFLSTAADGRRAGNPLFGTNFSDTVAVPNRRTYLFIQNQGTEEALIHLDPEGDNSATPISIKLYQGQSISFDNFNVGFTINPGNVGANTNIVIGEAFA